LFGQEDEDPITVGLVHVESGSLSMEFVEVRNIALEGMNIIKNDSEGSASI
jgi:hypothetical protein